MIFHRLGTCERTGGGRREWQKENKGDAANNWPHVTSLSNAHLFFLQPASKQLYEDETTSSVFGLRSMTDPSPSPTPSPCGSDRPLLVWSSNNSSSSAATSATVGPPVAEKPRWHLGRRTAGHFIPPDVTGTIHLRTSQISQATIGLHRYFTEHAFHC